MIYKNVKNVSNNLKDGGSLLQRIVVVDNSPIMWLYLCYSQINSLGLVQTPLHWCAEPNWWIKYGKRAASESIWYGSFSLVRQKR